MVDRNLHFTERVGQHCCPRVRPRRCKRACPPTSLNPPPYTSSRRFFSNANSGHSFAAPLGDVLAMAATCHTLPHLDQFAIATALKNWRPWFTAHHSDLPIRRQQPLLRRPTAPACSVSLTPMTSQAHHSRLLCGRRNSSDARLPLFVVGLGKPLQQCLWHTAIGQFHRHRPSPLRRPLPVKAGTLAPRSALSPSAASPSSTPSCVVTSTRWQAFTQRRRHAHRLQRRPPTSSDRQPSVRCQTVAQEIGYRDLRVDSSRGTPSLFAASLLWLLVVTQHRRRRMDVLRTFLYAACERRSYKELPSADPQAQSEELVERRFSTASEQQVAPYTWRQFDSIV